jgi:hypothetical protein
MCKLVRVILKQPSTQHSLPLVINLDVLPLKFLFIFMVLMMFYIRGGNRSKPIKYISKLRWKWDIYLSGSGIETPKPRNEGFKQIYAYLAPKLFCSLPNELWKQNSTAIFMRNLKQRLLSKESNEVEKLLKVVVWPSWFWICAFCCLYFMLLL